MLADTVKTYPLFSELHSMTISKADHFTLVENYVNHIVDGMDTDSLAAMVVDLLTREYENVPVDEIKEEILDLYDEETLNDLMPTEMMTIVEEPTLIPARGSQIVYIGYVERNTHDRRNATTNHQRQVLRYADR